MDNFNGQPFNIDEALNAGVSFFVDTNGGPHRKSFNMDYLGNLKASEFIKILNRMPNLESLIFSTDIGWITNDIAKNGAKLKVSKLRSLSIQSPMPHPSIYDFFTEHLSENSIIHHELSGVSFDEPFNRILFVAVQKFFRKQKAIKKFKTSSKEAFIATNVLTLDELEIGFNDFSSSTIALVLKYQPGLKILKTCRLKFNHGNEKVFEAIENLSKLEVLEIGFHGANFGIIKNLTSLKVFKSTNDGLFNNFDWISNRFDHLEELNVVQNSLDIDDVLECFPGLKVLSLRTTLKLNSILGALPKLQELSVNYNPDDYFEPFELNTGFVYENLKVLKVYANVNNFWKFAQKFSEFHGVAPNLEDLTLRIAKLTLNISDENPGRVFDGMNFFAKFNDWKNLKKLCILKIPIKFCEENFKEIAVELKNLTTKIQTVNFEFEDRIHIDDKWEKFSYKKLIKNIRGHYRITWKDRDTTAIGGETRNRCRIMNHNYINFELFIVHKQTGDYKGNEEKCDLGSDEEDEIEIV